MSAADVQRQPDAAGDGARDAPQPEDDAEVVAGDGGGDGGDASDEQGDDSAAARSYNRMVKRHTSATGQLAREQIRSRSREHRKEAAQKKAQALNEAGVTVQDLRDGPLDRTPGEPDDRKRPGWRSRMPGPVSLDGSDDAQADAGAQQQQQPPPQAAEGGAGSPPKGANMKRRMSTDQMVMAAISTKSTRDLLQEAQQAKQKLEARQAQELVPAPTGAQPPTTAPDDADDEEQQLRPIPDDSDTRAADKAAQRGVCCSGGCLVC
jgi:hypothetical protein